MILVAGMDLAEAKRATLLARVISAGKEARRADRTLTEPGRRP